MSLPSKEITKKIRSLGMTTPRWARLNGFSYNTVRNVAAGQHDHRISPMRDKILLALGMKDTKC